MRSSVAFALIGLNIACWTTIAAADDTTQATPGKGGKIVAAAPRQVDTTHGLSTAPEHTGAAVIANLRGAAAAASAIEPRVVSASANYTPASVVIAGSGNVANAANVATSTAGLYTGLTVTAVSAAGVKTEPSLVQAAGVVTSGAGTDRTGAVASSGSVTATLRPMGTAAAAGNFAAVGVRPDATTQQRGVVAVGGVLGAAANWKTSLSQGVESTHVRATVFADAPSSIAWTQTPGGVTPRAVGVWNSATSMGGPVQRVKPVRKR